MQDDAKIASIGRNLAEALQDWAYTRKDEDKKRITALNTELVRAVKEETLPTDQPPKKPVKPVKEETA